MQELAYTTSVVSWSLLLSAIRLVRQSDPRVTPIDLNLAAPPCAILCCVALEAFVNELSCLAEGFLFAQETSPPRRDSITPQGETTIGLSIDKCRKISQIKDCTRGSFYDRYKSLLKTAGIDKPYDMQSLSHLRDLRDSLVHFRTCLVPVVDDSNGIIRSDQQPPEVFVHLKSYKVHGWPVVAEDPDEVVGKWTLRISTNAMAAWSLTLVFDAIAHVIDKLPKGPYRDRVVRQYRSRDVAFTTVFEKGRADVEEWKSGLFLAANRD